MTIVNRCAVLLCLVSAVSLVALDARADGHAVLPATRAAHEMYERGMRASNRLASMLGEARRDRDRTRMQCLDGALTQVNSHLRTLLQRIERLNLAGQDGDERVALIEMQAIRHVSEALLDAESGVSVCIAGGAPIVRDGLTRVEVIVDPTVPHGETFTEQQRRRAMAPSAN